METKKTDMPPCKKCGKDQWEVIKVKVFEDKGLEGEVTGHQCKSCGYRRLLSIDCKD